MVDNQTFERVENVKTSQHAVDAEMGNGQRVAMLALAGVIAATAGKAAISLVQRLQDFLN
jgi:hypothetical protein